MQLSAAAAIASSLLTLQANVKRTPTAIERKLNLLRGVNSDFRGGRGSPSVEVKGSRQ